jgi:hypothetical protein
MSRRMNPGLVEALALARVAGVAVADWARENSVKVSTAYGWAASEAFKARVRVHGVDPTVTLVANSYPLLRQPVPERRTVSSGSGRPVPQPTSHPAGSH